MNQNMKPETLMKAARSPSSLKAGDLDHGAWQAATTVALERYWSGALAPSERRAVARALQTEEALLVRFDCAQREPLIMTSEPGLEHKTIGLWERDVCEIFLAPDAAEPERYFEFEAAPTGEWVDLAIRQTPEGRETDWEYESGMTAHARIEEAGVTIAMCIPWRAFGRMPQAGELWRANLFRCIGSGEGRGYLAWQPTRTGRPNFHVPEAFGWIKF